MNGKTRESIMVPLFTILQGGTATFKTISRDFLLWSDVPPEQRPALFLDEGQDEELQNKNESTPETSILRPQLVIYTAPRQNPGTSFAAQLNSCIDAVQTLLKPDTPRGLLTLGGLVSHVWINGKICKSPGYMDGDGVAIIPLEILVP